MRSRWQPLSQPRSTCRVPPSWPMEMATLRLRARWQCLVFARWRRRGCRDLRSRPSHHLPILGDAAGFHRLRSAAGMSANTRRPWMPRWRRARLRGRPREAPQSTIRCRRPGGRPVCSRTSREGRRHLRDEFLTRVVFRAVAAGQVRARLCRCRSSGGPQESHSLRKSGAGDGIRTHDPNLGKIALELFGGIPEYPIALLSY